MLEAQGRYSDAVAVLERFRGRDDTTERLAARLMHDPAAQPLDGLRLVTPVETRIDQRLHETGGNVNEGVAVAATGFEHTDADVSIARQPIREHRTG